MHPSIIIIDIKLQWQANKKKDKVELNKTQLGVVSQKTNVNNLKMTNWAHPVWLMF